MRFLEQQTVSEKNSYVPDATEAWWDSNAVFDGIAYCLGSMLGPIRFLLWYFPSFHRLTTHRITAAAIRM